jgi:hypothetical protein
MLLVKYRNGASADDRPILCKDEADLLAKQRDIEGRPEAVQVDVFIHDAHRSRQLVQEWRVRATIAKPETVAASNRPADVLPSAPPVPFDPETQFGKSGPTY